MSVQIIIDVLMPITIVGGFFAWIVPFVWNWKRTSGQLGERANLDIILAIVACGESDHELQELMARYPKSPLPALRWAERKIVNRAWDEAIMRGNTVSEKFPNEVAAHMVAVQALIGLNQLDRGEALVKQTIKKLGLQPASLIQYARIADMRRDWAEAALRWKAVYELAPTTPIGYVRGAAAFVELAQFEDAEEVLRLALTSVEERFYREVLLPYANLAHMRSDWPEAARRWSMVRARFDRESAGYWRGSEALRLAGYLAEAGKALEPALFMFGEDPDVVREAISLAAQQSQANSNSSIFSSLTQNLT